MSKRNPIAVLLLPFITFGIYSWYWLVKTKNEMNNLGEHIPTAWIWLIPFVGSLWWLWKYAEGVDHVTKGKFAGIIAFLLFFFLGCIGNAIVQDSFNQLATGATPATHPSAPSPAEATPQSPQKA